MTFSTKTKIRLALLFTVAAGGVAVVACGNGDDDDASPGTDAGAKLDATGGGGNDTGTGSGPEAGTPGDAAADDASDARVFTAPVSCAGYLYCEDFESYTDSGAIADNTALGPWTTSVGGKTDAGETAKMGVDSILPYSGSRALHVTAPAGEATDGELKRNTALDAGDIGGNLFGRAMVYFSDGPLPGGSAPLTDSGTYGLAASTTGGYTHNWIFAASGHSAEIDASVSANIIVGNPYLALNYSPGDYGPNGAHDAGPVTTGAWHCLQWQYDGSGSPPADVMNVWFDGVLEVHTDTTNKYSNMKFPTPTDLKMAADWTSFVFGFTHYQTTTIPQDVFLDDFALNTSMVACPTTP